MVVLVGLVRPQRTPGTKPVCSRWPPSSQCPPQVVHSLWPDWCDPVVGSSSRRGTGCVKDVCGTGHLCFFTHFD